MYPYTSMTRCVDPVDPRGMSHLTEIWPETPSGMMALFQPTLAAALLEVPGDIEDEVDLAGGEVPEPPIQGSNP